MRAGRLLSILLWLQNEGKLTTEQLAERLEVSKRTVLRDMDELSGSGIPVYAERGSQGGWQLSEGYRTTLTGMRGDEVVALLLAGNSQLLNDLGREKQLEDALQKLLAAVSVAARSDAAAARDKIHIDGAGWHQSGHSREAVPCLSLVQEAVWEERRLQLTYKRDGEESQRAVCPLGLVAKGSIWYLVAAVDSDTDREIGLDSSKLRTYRISRLVGAEKLAEAFSPWRGFRLSEYWEQSVARFKERLPRYPATVKIRLEAIERLGAARFVSVQKRKPLDGGWVEAEVLFETLDSACEIALGFGAGIAILSPQELRRAVEDELAAALRWYGDEQHS
ncbi:YafY family transcriptional regulator [Paenibacillus sp. J5C_2022]|uniref:helix-turn-helix transcriptional regulator n=1 Tax=Paenibacillus sp. J5C2022 TaxID=2977129 RepID=UPI0021D1BDF2|nr:YafY family protein [Paenibacillus sp. J5C2022]MCU6710602.1 YafY family transcriptional regulator [Paenibacillus sp. J5C2022]